jgi:hypothetical protein
MFHISLVHHEGIHLLYWLSTSSCTSQGKHFTWAPQFWTLSPFVILLDHPDDEDSRMLRKSVTIPKCTWRHTNARKSPHARPHVQHLDGPESQRKTNSWYKKNLSSFLRNFNQFTVLYSNGNFNTRPYLKQSCSANKSSLHIAVLCLHALQYGRNTPSALNPL